MAMCLDTQAASKKKESVGRVRPLHHLVGTVSMRLSVSLRLCPCAPIRLVMMCAVSYGSVHLSVCCVCHVCVCTRVTSSSRYTSGASNNFRLEWKIGRSSSPFFPGRCSVTIFLTDLDGTVTQHDGNFLAVDGFPFFDGNVFGSRR